MLITFEGIDGCGKSTQISLLEEVFEKRNIRYRIFREPGGVAISEKIRELLLDAGNRIDPVTELLLFSSARSQLVAEKVIPLLKEKTVVILDRFYDSTTAYQGYGRRFNNLETIRRLNKIASHDIIPDVTYYLSIPLDVAVRRRSGQAEDRMEKSGVEFFERVIGGFETLAANESRIVRLDALKEPHEVHADLLSDLSSRFPGLKVSD